MVAMATEDDSEGAVGEQGGKAFTLLRMEGLVHQTHEVAQHLRELAEMLLLAPEQGIECDAIQNIARHDVTELLAGRTETLAHGSCRFSQGVERHDDGLLLSGGSIEFREQEVQRVATAATEVPHSVVAPEAMPMVVPGTAPVMVAPVIAVYSAKRK